MAASQIPAPDAAADSDYYYYYHAPTSINPRMASRDSTGGSGSGTGGPTASRNLAVREREMKVVAVEFCRQRGGRAPHLRNTVIDNADVGFGCVGVGVCIRVCA